MQNSNKITFSNPTFTPTSPRTWPPLLTLTQASLILNISEHTIRRWVNKEKRLEATRVSTRGDMRFKKEDILKIIQEGIKKI
ncbi:helix-turn-helix domain-containing protein [Patescibacteria group bacterium]|nr:helix-turn-helix domain-containing protein [Patescibacteria group bacterium]MCG2701754.1 helix-turn-helix domain-containing protein [Candidatus Parcubacteria bacterium]MBU4264659.1 helix-turn-helix domain-containing protein [Patescibacteria group bacterium]MBU4390614.1 helix-turn-helix domain-containing protein [Patescibacteria group bacterium]MBU4397522.1 helix-turn-helix domain-containing protein [Patescibacteria group bacterium]